MENKKVNFMTRSEWLELFAYILAIGFAGFILNLAYQSAYVPAELAALVLIGVFGCLIVRHIHRADESREYRKWAFHDGAPDWELKTYSWRGLARLDRKIAKLKEEERKGQK